MIPVCIYNQDYIRKLDFEYYINKNFNIDATVVKQLSAFLGDLSKADDYQLKSDNVISGPILSRLLADFSEIDSQFFKYRGQVEMKFPGKNSDE